MSDPSQNHPASMHCAAAKHPKGGTVNELEKRLNAELSGESADVDSARIQALVDPLLREESAVDAEGRLLQNGAPIDETAVEEANWSAISSRLPHPRRRSGRLGRAIRIAACVAVCCVVLGVSSLKVAEAFQWNFMLRILQPFAGTLGLTLNVNTSDDVQLPEKEDADGAPEIAVGVEPDEDSDVLQRSFSALSEVPASLSGNPTIPGYVPEGYAFDYAAEYEDSFETRLLLCYRSGQDELFVQTVTYKDPEYITVSALEKDPDLENTSGNPALYSNESTNVGVYVNDTSYLTVWGSPSQSTIAAIIQSMRGE